MDLDAGERRKNTLPNFATACRYSTLLHREGSYRKVCTPLRTFPPMESLQAVALRLVLINKVSLDAVRGEVSALASYSYAAVLRLVGPTLDSHTGITFGGRLVGPNESWKPDPAQRVQLNSGSSCWNRRRPAQPL